jgi:translation elongation factor EF-Ts
MNESDKLLIRKLKEETGCGMLDCRRAYIDFNGDIEKAKHYLIEREKFLDATMMFRTKRPYERK